jgi:phosphoglycerate kinase
MGTGRIRTLADVDVKDKVVLVRVDFNVPMDGDRITDDTRIRAAIPTLKALREKGAKSLILMSHLGRPADKPDPKYSLLPVAARLAEILGEDVLFSHDPVSEEVARPLREAPNGGVLVLENLRFDPREKKGDAASPASCPSSATCS